jgi:hypothetical protein
MRVTQKFKYLPQSSRMATGIHKDRPDMGRTARDVLKNKKCFNMIQYAYFNLIVVDRTRYAVVVVVVVVT